MIINFNDFILEKNNNIISHSRGFSDSLKEEIKKYITSNSTYRKGVFLSLSLPKIKGKSFKGVGFGADKNGFFVYTHRARSKSKDTPINITPDEIKFIKSTG